jgi:CRISPR/Cas system Type II protein with McrA/HNH and RuvC-like nuclease domain
MFFDILAIVKRFDFFIKYRTFRRLTIFIVKINMKEDILKLRTEGKTYNEIVKILGCSKSTVSYYCGENQKLKTMARTTKRRKNVLLAKVETFKYKPIKNRKSVIESIRKFQKRDNGHTKGNVNKNIETTFTWSDVLEKYTEDTYCYLSGEPINLYDNNYQLDHIIPSSKGGDNTFSNLGITHETVNKMKGDLTPDELIAWCIKILSHNGYNVRI